MTLANAAHDSLVKQLRECELHVIKDARFSTYAGNCAVPTDLLGKVISALSETRLHAFCERNGCDLLHPKQSSMDEANSLRASDGGREPVSQPNAVLNSHSTASSATLPKTNDESWHEGYTEGYQDGLEDGAKEDQGE